MKRIVIVLALALSLGGCASFPSLESLKTAIHFGTASVANPITKTRLNQMENGIKVLFSGLNAWKRSCVQGVIPAVCKEQIRAVQVYTLQVHPYLDDLRRFVKTNDQVNAIVVWNQLTEIIGRARTKAAESGVSIAAAPGA